MWGRYLHYTNEEASHRADEGGCLRTHRKPVTEAGNWMQTKSSSWVPSPSRLADRSPLLLGLWNLSLVGFRMNLFFFFPHLSSHYVSLDSHFCFVKAFDPASFLFWLKKPTTEHQTEFTPYSLVCSPTNINLSLLLSAKCPLHSTQCCVLCAPCAHDCGFIKSHQRYLEGESYL